MLSHIKLQLYLFLNIQLEWGTV